MERTPLTGKQYSALQSLFAIVSGFTAGLDFLRERAIQAGCWEEMQSIGTMSQECLDKILLTVEEKKLRQIRAELANVRLHIKVEPDWARTTTKGMSYVPTDVLNDLLNHVCQTECLMCNKSAKEARHCEFRKLIDDALPHEVEHPEYEGCKYSDMVLGL